MEILHQNGDLENLVFFDDVNDDIHGLLYNQFPILKNLEEAKNYFQNTDKRFTIGIGNPILRKNMFSKFSAVGGQATSVISSLSEIGSYGVSIDEGCVVMGGVRISNDVKIGKGTMIYYNSVITHDVEIGDFVEVSPGSSILGRAKIGHNAHIATGAIIFPDLWIGSDVTVGAGSVVTRNLPDNCTAVGAPAKIIKHG